MKVVTIVAFMLLVVLPAGAGQRRDQRTSPPVICDNDGRCTTHNAASASVVSNQTTRRKIYTATAVATASPTAGSVTETPTASTKEVATTAPVVSTADSELASEVTLQSVRRFDFDAAVLYSETLVVPLGLGTFNRRNDHDDYGGYRSGLHGSDNRGHEDDDFRGHADACCAPARCRRQQTRRYRHVRKNRCACSGWRRLCRTFPSVYR